jgi:hypothetical protein
MARKPQGQGMDQPRADADELRRKAHHDTVKARVDRDINVQLAAHADQTSASDDEKMEKVAGDFRGKAIEEVAGQDRDVRRARVLARVSQVVDYVFFCAYGLLAIRLALTLIGASGQNGFVRGIRAVTYPLYAMFVGIVPSPSAGGFTLALPIVIALIVYALFHVGVTRLLRLIAHRQTSL